MAAFRDAFPVLMVADMGRSLGFYRDQPGFDVTYTFPSAGEPGFASLAIEGGKLALATAV